MTEEETKQLQAGTRLIRRKRAKEPDEPIFEIVFVCDKNRTTSMPNGKGGNSLLVRCAKTAKEAATQTDPNKTHWLYPRNLVLYDPATWIELQNIDKRSRELLAEVARIWGEGGVPEPVVRPARTFDLGKSPKEETRFDLFLKNGRATTEDEA